jgi:hypothetical protein
MRIPWRLHLKAWQKYAQHYPGQSAERMAERGGFGLLEVIYLLAGENPFETTDEGPMFTNFFNEWPEEEKLRREAEKSHR